MPAAVLAQAGNRLLKSQELIHRLQEIEGAKICLLVDDMDLELYFEVKAARLHPGRDKNWDMRIAGTLNHFLALATRSEDPDTLFFNRSLVLEGKTEIGLYVKNLLDAMDLGIDRQLEALTGRKPPLSVSRLLTKAANRLRSMLDTNQDQS